MSLKYARVSVRGWSETGEAAEGLQYFLCVSRADHFPTDSPSVPPHAPQNGGASPCGFGDTSCSVAGDPSGEVAGGGLFPVILPFSVLSKTEQGLCTTWSWVARTNMQHFNTQSRGIFSSQVWRRTSSAGRKDSDFTVSFVSDTGQRDMIPARTSTLLMFLFPPGTVSQAEEADITLEYKFSLTGHVKWYKAAVLEVRDQTSATALGEDSANLSSPGTAAASTGICGCQVFITRINWTGTGNDTQRAGPSKWHRFLFHGGHEWAEKNATSNAPAGTPMHYFP